MEGISLVDLAGADWSGALEARSSIPALAARLAGIAPPDEEKWRFDVLSRCVSLTLLAGSGSRWQSSLAVARNEGRLSGPGLAFDPSAPRGLFPVRDFISPGRSVSTDDHPATIPIAAYSLAAVAGAGSHVVVVRDREGEIRRGIVAALGLRQEEWRFAVQEVPYGKPLGHGDAAWQSRALWRGSDWVVANFGGDANSRFTVEASLLAMAALDAGGEGADFLLPAALVREPAYPITLDFRGHPLAFGHAKLSGSDPAAGQGPGWTGLANVGLRIYRAEALAAALEELRAAYWVEGKGYAIPGNAADSGECALDNADALFAERGRARVLAFARERELSPAKTVGEIPRFESSIAQVVAEDRLLLRAGPAIIGS